MWAFAAAVGSAGRSREHSCVDDTVSPLGRRAVSGVAVGRRLVAGASGTKKWLVAPESTMAHSLKQVSVKDTVLRMLAAVWGTYGVGYGRVG